MTSLATDLPERMQQLEQQIEDLRRSAGTELQTDIQRMVQTILDFHAAGLTRLLEFVSESGETGRSILERCAHDELVGNLLLLHDLHPWDLTVRVRLVLDGIRPQLHPQGVQLLLLSANAATVKLRLLVDAGGVTANRSQLQSLIAEAVAAAVPEVGRIEFEEASPGPMRFPLPLVDAGKPVRS